MNPALQRTLELLLIIGIFIARQYTLRAKLVTAFLVIVLTSLGVLAVLDGHIMSERLIDAGRSDDEVVIELESELYPPAA